jgi:drug/metabolite transporter (DMT)-like permease
MTNKHLPLFLTIVASLTFILPAALIKLLMDEISPVGTLTIRFFIATICFFIVIGFWDKKKLYSIIHATKDELEHFGFMSLFLFGNMALGFTAFYFIPANKGIMIWLMYPIFDSIFAWAFLHEKITKADMAAIVLTVIGAYFILGLNGNDDGSVIGYTLTIIGTMLFAGYLVMSRSVGKHYDYYKRTGWLFIFCFFFLCITFLLTGGISTVGELSNKAWLFLLLFGVGATLIPYMCLSYATAKIKSTLVSIIIVFGPVIGIGLVTWVFNEPFTTNMWIGGACVLGAFLIGSIIQWVEEEKIPRKKKHIKHLHH